MEENFENLPIDISSNKLLDWLIDRRHVNQKWQGEARAIREKINHAIQDMPEVEEIKKLLSGTYINYFHCVRIVELLKVSESESKNIFGYYSSQRMKDWQEVVRLYEKDSVGLAEVADMLIRNVAYEVPALKKQIASCQQAQTECDKKEKSYSESAVTFKEDYKRACRDLGIEGNKIRSELLALVSELPSVYDTLEKDAKLLTNVAEFYGAFVKFTLAQEEDSDSLSNSVVPLLKFMIKHGNATTYQWRTGEAPTNVEEVKLWFLEEEEEANEDEIDWGVVDIDAGGIDFGDDSGAIDFGDGDSPSDGISWDIETTADPTADLSIGGIVPTSREGVARGTDALSVLDNVVTRNQFNNELLELEAFLTQRLCEMKGEADILSVNQFQSAPQILQMKTVSDVEEMLESVCKISSRLNDTRLQHLFMLKSSPKYVDRLTDSLKKKLEQEEKMLASKVAVQEKRQSLIEKQKQLEPKLDLLIKRTRELQTQIEKEISKRYKNRPVNLMGAINTI